MSCADNEGVLVWSGKWSMLFCPLNGVILYNDNTYNCNVSGLRCLIVLNVISTDIHVLFHTYAWKTPSSQQLSTNNSSNMCRLCVVCCLTLSMYWAFEWIHRNSRHRIGILVILLLMLVPLIRSFVRLLESRKNKKKN